MQQVALRLTAQLGATDCEAIRDGILAQPANTVSSLAYLVTGLALVVRAARRPAAAPGVAAAYGLAIAGVGLGSVAFHGPMPAGAQVLHDAAIVAVFAVIAAHAVGTLLGWSQAVRIGLAALLTLVDAALLGTWRAAGLVAAAVIVVAAVALELVVQRAGRRHPAPRHVRLLAGTAVLLIVAGAVNVLGRTDAPLCAPASLLQGHALWHVLTAVAFGVYGLIAFPDRARRVTPRQ